MYDLNEEYDNIFNKYIKEDKSLENAVVYFDLVTQDDEIEEDNQKAEDGDATAKSNLKQSALGFPVDYEKVLNLEEQAIKEFSSKFNIRVENEGHDSSALVCKFHINSLEELKSFWDKIPTGMVMDFDTFTLNTPYIEFKDFRFYPDGINNGFYGVSSSEGSIPEYLENQI